MFSNVNRLHGIYFLLFLSLGKTVSAHFFTSLADIEDLLIPHERIIKDLSSYIDMQDQKLSILKSYLDLYIKENRKAMENIPEYLGNPINVFLLIKRLVSDLDYVPVIIRTGAEYIIPIFQNHGNISNPKQEELIGAAQAVARLQKVYHLNVKELADGNLNNIAHTTPMTASDCYELGQALILRSKAFKTGRAWMLEAYRKYLEENTSYPFTEVDILKHINITNEGNRSQRGITEEDNKLKEELKRQTVTNEKVLKTYEALCRGDLVVPTKISSRLTCRYLTESHPFLKLAPYKIEMMYLNPDVMVFYDVLSDVEIKTIKEWSRPSLERATINDPETGARTTASYRISKVVFVFDKDSDTIARISRRVSYMTGLNTETSNQLQVVNYGIGGHYEPHYDFGIVKNNATIAALLGGKQVMATTLFYMSDVAQGGATVFPELGVAMYPKKGAALFWFNLHPSGEGNLAMQHAACPVLQGDKWVVSKFVLISGQHFLKPCNLEYQKEGFVNKIPHPEYK